MLPMLILLVALTRLESVTCLKPASHYFPICHKSNPDLAKCIKNSIEDLRPRLVKGIPELNLVPLDPLFVPRMEMRDGSGNFKFRQVLTNLNIFGLRNFVIKNITTDLDKSFMTITCLTKTIDFVGDYEMEGKIMVIDIKGKGQAVFNFTDVTTIAYIQSETIQKKGVNYNRVKSLKWTIEPQNAKFHFTNLFNGDKTLGDATNKFLNDNWREAYSIYRNLPEQAFGDLMKDLANRVYTLFPIDELYPD